jgi:hypothetical protein
MNEDLILQRKGGRVGWARDEKGGMFGTEQYPEIVQGGCLKMACLVGKLGLLTVKPHQK